MSGLMSNNKERIKGCIVVTLPKAIKTCLWMLKIILPISLCVRIAQYVGVMKYVGMLASAIFPLVGLPSDAAIVFFTSCFLPIYAPIALMATMELTIKQATILSLMCLASHNLPVECAVASKTGSSFWAIMILRITASFIMAIIANILLPENNTLFAMSQMGVDCSSLLQVLTAWILASWNLIKTLAVIVTTLMFVQAVLEEFGIIQKISKIVSPIIRVMGLPENTTFLWLVGNIVGLSYGSAIMIGMASEGKINPYEADLVNRHLAVNHSILEDTFLFSALGICAWWLLLFRIPLAIIVVWGKRLNWSRKRTGVLRTSVLINNN